ncbi:hypothetical protein BDV96DRAFT_596336 [Lophiotrema nucula]|uniref:Lactonase, 7-bladed beta-propeller-domain-containing protein n=1 Tax=Lophiotrema nucula TaxID=690887 RepID=A0A6A5ZJS9_9PLEO|nr:hypothetical protein BDV96DRAFT_596336 [Lophiotrema nucula]
MKFLLVAMVLAGCGNAALHHLFVGTTDGSSLYTLELDDQLKQVSLVKNNAAAGASPSMVVHRSKQYLFGSRPSDGTVSRYGIKDDLSLTLEGTMDIPASCNTTAFTDIKLSSDVNSFDIYGSASTGNCSTLFATSTDGFYTMRSREILGDIRSLAWSPNGLHLFALDYKTHTVLNFNITDTGSPTLEDVLDNALLSNVTNPRQMISHPTGHRIYAITQDSNELLDVPLSTSDRVAKDVVAARFNVLPSTLKASDYTTQSLAISSSNSTLWTLSRSNGQSVISVFSLDPTTGAVLRAIARAAWKDVSASKNSLIAPAPFAGDIIAVSNSPLGIVAFIGLNGTTLSSYGRLDLGSDPGCCGEAVWLS